MYTIEINPAWTVKGCSSHDSINNHYWVKGHLLNLWCFQELRCLYVDDTSKSIWEKWKFNLVGGLCEKQKHIVSFAMRTHVQKELKLYLKCSINSMGKNCHCELMSYSEKHFLCVIDTKIRVVGFKAQAISTDKMEDPESFSPSSLISSSL